VVNWSLGNFLRSLMSAHDKSRDLVFPIDILPTIARSIG